jgi:hypothetical protein
MRSRGADSNVTGLLGEPSVIERLTPQAIAALSSRFDVLDLANELRVLAIRFLESDDTDAATRRLAWHHLLMAVTNFKASAANARLGIWDTGDRRYDAYSTRSRV